jgi:MFS family permease
MMQLRGINVSEVSEQQANVFIGRIAIRRVTRRIIPFVFLMYITAWLDRVNVGFAGLHMNADLGFSASIFGFGSGIFFLGYCLLEVPSNLILHRVGARLWLARIMVTWGVLSSAMMLVRTPLSFYALRFLLGAAEAGFFPGVLYYLSEWYPQEQRTDMQIGLISAGISAVMILAMLGNSAHSDKTDERPLHVAVPLTIQAAGFLGCALLPTPFLQMLSLALVPLGHGAAYGPFWSMPTRFLTGQAAAGGLAVVATIVNVGGFIGPLLIGLLKEHTGNYASAFVVLSVAAMISAIMALRLRRSRALNTRSPYP